MDLDEIKEKITTEIQAMGGGIPFDPDSLPNNWNDLLTELKAIINHIEISTCQLIKYEWYVEKEVKKDT